MQPREVVQEDRPREFGAGVACFGPHAQVGQLVDALCAHPFHGFPIVKEAAAGPRSLLGTPFEPQFRPF
jgi:hypothetical protein